MNLAQARYKAKLLRQGRCVSCAKPNDRLPLRLCSRCAKPKTYTAAEREQYRDYNHAKYWRRRSCGLCVDCGMAAGKFATCLRCRLMRVERRSKWRKAA